MTRAKALRIAARRGDRLDDEEDPTLTPPPADGRISSVRGRDVNDIAGKIEPFQNYWMTAG